MARPTESDFDEYISALPVMAWIGEEIRSSDMMLTKPYQIDVEHFLRGVIELREKHFRALSKYAVPKWINAQPTGSRAYRALYRKKTKNIFSVEPYARNLVARATRIRTAEEFKINACPSEKRTEKEVASWVERQNSVHEIERRIRSYCSYFANWNPVAVESGIASAFRDYFYAERSKRLAKDGKDSLEFAKNLLSMITAIRSAEGANVFVPVGPTPIRYLDSTEKQLNDFISRFNPQALPIRRIDATAKERALAFDLWRCFYGAVRSGKPKAIAYMMEFEGVSQPIDVRTLERMTADWKLGLPFIRHLIMK